MRVQRSAGFLAKNMLDKNTIFLRGCPRLGGNPCPNAMITYRTNISSRNVRIARLNCQDDCQFESAAITIPRLANFQSNGSRAILSVCCIQVQTKLVRVNQLTARNAVNPNRPRSCPKKSSTVEVYLCKRLVGDR